MSESKPEIDWVQNGTRLELPGLAVIVPYDNIFDVIVVRTPVSDVYLSTADKLLELFVNSGKPEAIAVLRSYAMQILPALQARKPLMVELEVEREYGSVVANTGREVQRLVQSTVTLKRKI